MTDKEIINNEKYHTCGRCKHENTPDDKYPCVACIYGTDHRTDLWELKQQPCEDCISRQEAILQVQRYGVGCFDAEEFSPEQCERFVIQKLNDLPPVTPKERIGKWETTTTTFCGRTFEVIQCSCCKQKQDWYAKTDFCPNCGARMEIKNDNG